MERNALGTITPRTQKKTKEPVYTPTRLIHHNTVLGRIGTFSRSRLTTCAHALCARERRYPRMARSPKHQPSFNTQSSCFQMESHLKLIGGGRTKEKHSRTAKFPTRARRASELRPTAGAPDLFGAAFALVFAREDISKAVHAASFPYFCCCCLSILRHGNSSVSALSSFN